MNAVLTGNFTPCLREWLCEIAFVTKKSITWPFFMRASDRPQFWVTIANHIIARRTNIIVASIVDFGFRLKKNNMQRHLRQRRDGNQM
jgi:hypothetical protein